MREHDYFPAGEPACSECRQQLMVIVFGQAVVAVDLTSPCYGFPSPEQFQEAKDELRRTPGLSAEKIATLRCVADALGSGTLDQMI